MRCCCCKVLPCEASSYMHFCMSVRVDMLLLTLRSCPCSVCEASCAVEIESSPILEGFDGTAVGLMYGGVFLLTLLAMHCRRVQAKHAVPNRPRAHPRTHAHPGVSSGRASFVSGDVGPTGVVVLEGDPAT